MKFSYILLLLAVVALNSCGSYYQQEPVGYDPDPSALKKSPCACMKVDMVNELPEFLFTGYDV